MIGTVGSASMLRRSLHEGVRRARSTGLPVLVSWTEADPSLLPLDVYARGGSLASSSFYWERPAEGFALAAVGAAHTLIPRGEDRFGETAQSWRALLAGALIDGESSDILGTGPIAVGGFSFDPWRPKTQVWRAFPDGRLHLPRYMLTAAGNRSWLTVNSVVQPTADPEDEAARLAAELHFLRGARSSTCRDNGYPVGTVSGSRPRGSTNIVELLPARRWRGLVRTARDAIRQGQIEKIVLARAVRAAGSGSLPSGWNPAVALSRLRESYPGCSVFAATYGESTFLGATPERLVRLRDRMVHVDCLAGTVGRGATEEDDRRLGAHLLGSAKDRSEHEVVLRMLVDRLGACCTDLSIPPEPALVRLRNVQHLYTPIAGKVINGRDILALVEQLHPSPAVGGFPVAPAERFIREHEELDRGWYAGPIGWMDRHGEGEFAVAIRSALLQGAEAILFAGCGIMADSDPDSEYEESCLKLESMLSILGGREAGFRPQGGE